MLGKCECECGKIKNVVSANLKNGSSKSCGCVFKTHPHHKTHGLGTTRQYRIWTNMISRCTNKNIPKYKDYGDRGITICNKWLNFSGFWEDMVEGYDNNLTLDRIDVNGNYEKSNCRWTTGLKQAQNKTINIYVNYNGENIVLSELSRKYNIDYWILYHRIKVAKWDAERAIKTPNRLSKSVSNI